jgi:putative flippase GtrA
MNKFFGKFFNRETITYIFFGVLTTLIGFAVFAAALWLFEKIGWFAGDSPELAEMMANHSWLKHVPNLSASLQVFIANIISWFFAIAFSFIVNKLYVFNSKSWHKRLVVKELTGFIGTRMFSLAAETAVLFLMVGMLGYGNIIAKTAGMIVVIILNYVLSKLFVFKKAIS